jgi:hypothetical protein
LKLHHQRINDEINSGKIVSKERMKELKSNNQEEENETYLTSVPHDMLSERESSPSHGTQRGVDGALTNVISSLDKLVDLEKRISKLEKERVDGNAINEVRRIFKGCNNAIPNNHFQLSCIFITGCLQQEEIVSNVQSTREDYVFRLYSARKTQTNDFLTTH